MIDTIIENVNVPYSSLNKNLMANLLVILQNTKEKQFTKTHGYIKKIIKIDSIVDSAIYITDCACILTIKYSFEYIKLDTDTIYNSLILAIYQEGMIVQIEDVFKSLVIDGEYINDTYTCKCGCIFTQSMVIPIKLQEIELIRGQFTCVGKHFCVL